MIEFKDYIQCEKNEYLFKVDNSDDRIGSIQSTF